MKFNFKIQQYQTDAVDAVVKVFQGQGFHDKISYIRDLGKKTEPQNYQITLDMAQEDSELLDPLNDTGYKNELVELSDEQLLKNIQTLQSQNNIKLSPSLVKNLGRCSLDIEMETGTGKTYVYIKTMFELNRKYGWSKFTHHEEILGSDHCPIGLDIHLSWQATQPYEKGQIRQKRPQIDFPDEYLAALWEQTDWDAAEENLANLQRELAQAASHRDMEKITALQKRLVRLPVCKFLAVRRVCAGNSGPGLDGVKWKTAADKARAALLLNSDGYRAQPLRNIKVHSKSTGRDRMMGLPTFFDRAMQVLYGFSLLSVLEAWADKKSFAFREGRSMQDCHAYILQALQGRDALGLVLLADVQAYYSHIQHGWLLENVPMDKKVLGEFLRAGYVFAGELFPEEAGLSLGSNISPALGNFVLDGLQSYIYYSRIRT